MPLYRVLTEQGALSAPQKADIAERIVEMHLRLAGGIRAFVNVLYEEYQPQDAFVGGKPGSPCYLSGSIRRGRPQEVKTRILHELSALFVDVTGIPAARLLISVGEVSAQNVMEAGHILPEPGEEAAWLEKVGAAFQPV